MISEHDKAQLAQEGISEDRLLEQLEQFKTGFPFLKLAAAASAGQGIVTPSAEERERLVAHWDKVSQELDVVKFVPASGAASRMFKDLFAFLDAPYDAPETRFESTFFSRLHDFAFYEALADACQVVYGDDPEALVEQGRYKDVVRALLLPDGLNYGQLPKGLLLFHAYADSMRTPAEEHLAEGALYARQAGGQVKLHFTVSPEHRPLFEALVGQKSEALGREFDATFSVSFSEQKSSTNTVAVNPDNTLFRNDDGSLLFRPGGHGALIENLNDIAADVVFIKNIDNVVPDRLKASTVANKKLLAGLLTELQAQAFAYLRQLETGQTTEAELDQMQAFLEKRLCCRLPQGLDNAQRVQMLRTKLNRPMRVCGMVKNVGEPGGGPFLVQEADGSVALQILESSQIDTADPKARAMFEQGTHFNPVDLVCGLKDYRGQAFHLPQYVDPKTGFISSKSKNGRELKALELPGLWNGAMSNWNTVFVEVPLDTFNPVKTVNDLLREQHQ